MRKQLYPKHEDMEGLEAEGSISLFWCLPDGDVTTRGIELWAKQIEAALEVMCRDMAHMVTMPGHTTYSAHLRPSASVRLFNQDDGDGQGIRADISFILENIWDVDTCVGLFIRLGAWRDAIRKRCQAMAEWIKFLIEETAPWQDRQPYELSIGVHFNEFFPTDETARILSQWDGKSEKEVMATASLGEDKEAAA